MALRQEQVDPIDTFGEQIRKNHLTRKDEDRLRKDARKQMDEQLKSQAEVSAPKFVSRNKTTGRHRVTSGSSGVKKSTITTNPYESERKKAELQQLIIKRAKELK